MVRMQRLIVIVLMCMMTAALSSCTSNRHDISAIVENIQVDLNHLDIDSVPLSMLADSVSLLALEATEESIIGRISDVKCTAKGIVIADNKSNVVYLYDYCGDFIRKIGSCGQGPGEYLNMHGIDATDSCIFIYDIVSESVKRYDYDGHYQGRDRIGSFDDFKVLDGGRRYLAASFNMADSSGVYLINPTPKYSKTKLLGRRDPVDINHSWEFYSYGDTVNVMSSAFENNLYRFQSDSLVKILELDATPEPSGLEIERWTRPDAQNHYLRTTYLNFPDYYIAYYSRYPDLRIIIVDRVKATVTVTSDIYNDFTEEEYSKTRGVFNGMPIFYIQGDDEDSNPRLMFLHLKK